MSQRDACTEIKGASFAVLLVVFPTIFFCRHNWPFKILHTSECQISANCSVLPSVSFLWLTYFKWLLSCILWFTWKSNSSWLYWTNILSLTGAISRGLGKNKNAANTKEGTSSSPYSILMIRTQFTQVSGYPVMGRSEHPLPTETS